MLKRRMFDSPFRPDQVALPWKGLPSTDFKPLLRSSCCRLIAHLFAQSVIQRIWGVPKIRSEGWLTCFLDSSVQWHIFLRIGWCRTSYVTLQDDCICILYTCFLVNIYIYIYWYIDVLSSICICLHGYLHSCILFRFKCTYIFQCMYKIAYINDHVTRERTCIQFKHRSWDSKPLASTLTTISGQTGQSLLVTSGLICFMASSFPCFFHSLKQLHLILVLNVICVSVYVCYGCLMLNPCARINLQVQIEWPLSINTCQSLCCGTICYKWMMSQDGCTLRLDSNMETVESSSILHLGVIYFWYMCANIPFLSGLKHAGRPKTMPAKVNNL